MRSRSVARQTAIAKEVSALSSTAAQQALVGAAEVAVDLEDEVDRAWGSTGQPPKDWTERRKDWTERRGQVKQLLSALHRHIEICHARDEAANKVWEWVVSIVFLSLRQQQWDKRARDLVESQAYCQRSEEERKLYLTTCLEQCREERETGLSRLLDLLDKLKLRLAPPQKDGNPPKEPEEAHLRLEGQIWTIGYMGETGLFSNRQDSILRHLGKLLAAPYRRFSATAFYPPPPGAPVLPYMGQDVTSDKQKLKECKKEMQRLVQEIKEADDAHDTEEADRLRKDFGALAKELGGEKAARKRGGRKLCGTPAEAEKAGQALRMGMERLKKRFRTNGLPKLAAHLDKHIYNQDGEWWYGPPHDASLWHVTCPDPPPEN
jgi:hypothetical protein